jgi:squalene-associated FAD-dependent desaturase
MAAAVAAVQNGHAATVFEAARAVGGRARALNGTFPDGTPVVLDNGQHIMIGAYTETLRLMQLVGVKPQTALLRTPLNLQFADGSGLALPAWPAPLDALAGMLTAGGWGWADKWSLLRASAKWQLQGFNCPAHTTVTDLCATLTPTVINTLIDPLCVSALNTPAQRASGQVFLTVLRDSLLGGQGSSNLLLPMTDLARLFPQAAAQWLASRGAEVRLGARVESLRVLPAKDSSNSGVANIINGSPHWQVNGEPFDAVIWATSSSNAAAALVEYAQAAPESIATALSGWAATAQALQFEAIATVYAWAPGARLRQPMLSLHSNAATAATATTPATPAAPAQFVFDRGQLGGPAGLLAFVVSASNDDRDTLQAQVLAQAQAQLGLTLQPVQTVVEKRATFACTPALVRPPMHIAPGLLACGDYIVGPYPATLEGAVRNGWAAGNTL